MVKMFNAFVEVIQQMTRQLFVLLTRIAQLFTRQRCVNPCFIAARQIIQDACIVEQITR